MYIAKKLQRRLLGLWVRLRQGNVGHGITCQPGLEVWSWSCFHVGNHVALGRNLKIENEAKVTIGDLTIIGRDVIVMTGEHGLVRDGIPFRYQQTIHRPVTIGRNCYIGSRALILGGVTIGDDVIVAAGAVVTRSVQNGQTIGGVPARLLVSKSSDAAKGN